MKLSIIVPAMNEEENVGDVVECISKVLKDVDYEIIFIDDGSTDRTYEALEKLYKKYKDSVRAISFSRNFGKDSAIYAGLEHSKGEYIAIIDADMEQNPSYLVEMLDFLEKNDDYDQVAMTIKKRKAGSFIKRLGGKAFYGLMNILSDVKFAQDASDFRMFRGNVKDALLSLPEKSRFSKGIFSWIGFKTKFMEYEVGERTHGVTKFNFKSSFKYAIDGIVGFSIRPLRIATFLGTLTSLSGFIYLIYIIIKTVLYGIDSPGFATIVCLILFIGGIQLICLGILGEYMARTFVETKKRPVYIARKKIGFEEEIL